MQVPVKPSRFGKQLSLLKKWMGKTRKAFRWSLTQFIFDALPSLSYDFSFSVLRFLNWRLLSRQVMCQPF
jgi:hypothetical protein